MIINKNIYQYLFFSLLAFFLLLGFFTANQYGMTWDEAAQQHVGRVALDYLQGHTDKMEFLREDLVYYGPFFEIANQYFSWSLLESFDISFVVAFHVLIILSAALGLLFLFKLVSKIFNPQIAFWSSVFLVLLPRFIAHSQYNSKDIPLLSGFVMVFYFLYGGFVEKKRLSLVWAGVFFGLTLAIRLDAILILPIFFIPFWLTGGNFKRIKNFLWPWPFLGISALAIYLVWPSLWSDPILIIDSFKYFLHHGWQGSVLYLGQVYQASQLPWHYAPVYLFLTIPLVILILIGFGFFKVFRDLRNRKNIFAYIFILTWIFLRVFLAILPGAVRYDGVRHFLPILPALMVVAALGFAFILKKLRKKNILKTSLVVIVSVWLLVEFFIIFPFGGSYFNEITRLIYPQNIEDRMEIEYWGATYKQGVDWLNQNSEQNSSFCVPIAQHLLQFYPIRQDLTFNCEKDANYLMFFTRWSYLPVDMEEIFDYKKSEPVFSLERYNSNLLEIFKIEK